MLHLLLSSPNSCVCFSNQYQADLPIWRALKSRCPIAASPSDADLFLVPFLYGSGATLKWGEYWRYSMRAQIDAIQRNATRLLHRLPHLSAETAARHVLLFTIDVEFVDLHKIAPPLLRQALVVHLGDDHVPCRAKFQLSTRPLDASISVPYRVSQWCPLGFPPPIRPKTRLLLANINPNRHATRGILAGHLRERAKALGIESRVLFPSDIREASSGSALDAARPHRGKSIGIGTQENGENSGSSIGGENRIPEGMLGPREAAEAALASTFTCALRETRRGFTARLWFSIAHGCIPVRYDGFHRNLTSNQTAYPFADRVDWSRMVVKAPDTANGTLLDMLLEMPQATVESRLRYLRRVRSMLMYADLTDSSGAGSTSNLATSPPHVKWPQDPPQLLIEQLEKRLLR